MIEHESKPSDTAATPSPSDNATSELTSPRVAKEQQSKDRRENRRWWLKLLIQPLLFLLCGAVLLASLGVAQRYGLISSSGHDGKTSGSAAGGRYSLHLPNDVHPAADRTRTMSGLRDGARAGCL